MNFFEKELRKLVGQSETLADPRYIGRACYGRVSDDVRIKLEFVIMGTHDQYEALKATLINNTEGMIDSNSIILRDIWEQDSDRRIRPQICSYDGKYKWYEYQPTPADYESLASSVDDYIEMFGGDMEYGQTMT